MVVLLAVILAASGASYLYGRSQSPAGLDPQDKKSLALYAEALDKVRDDYVDRKAIDPRKQTYGAIEGMLDSLGDKGHTRFLTPAEVKDNREGLSGTYVGIGVQLQDEEKGIVVTAPIEGSPADAAGMESGDVVVAVNGKSVRGEDISRVARKVRGPEGTRVEITVMRDGRERRFSIERAEIRAPVASWLLIPGTDTAQIRLSSFSDDSAAELSRVLDEARVAGARRFILDLRDNPGGRLDQAVKVAGEFLKPGSVIYIRKDSSGKREEVKVSDDAKPIDAPLVVLVNNGSASSSEILAGALRDNDRATVVGTRTFGTGTVLSEFTLSDGSAILLGVAEWLTPNGDFIRDTGIEPDIKVKPGKDDEAVTPSGSEGLSKQEILSRDAQLRRAFEEVRQAR